jgi:hypothetical protein
MDKDRDYREGWDVCVLYDGNNWTVGLFLLSWRQLQSGSNLYKLSFLFFFLFHSEMQFRKGRRFRMFLPPIRGEYLLSDRCGSKL